MNAGMRAAFERWFNSPPQVNVRGYISEQPPGQCTPYEKEIAWHAWCAATRRCIGILEQYLVPGANVADDELVSEWPKGVFRRVRDELESKG